MSFRNALSRLGGRSGLVGGVIRPAHQHLLRVDGFHSSSRAHESVGGFWGFLGRLVISNLSASERKVFADQLHPAPPSPAPVEVVKEVVKEVEVKVSVPAPPPEEHPVLGRLLFDFGFKRIYSMQPSKLCDARLLPVWNLQRSFRLDRAETIAKAKLKRPEMGFPGVISVYELPSPGGGEGFRAILDGQHRVGALRLMAARGQLPSSHERLLVEVFPLRNEQEAEALFVEINQAQPVLLVDMPSSGGGAPIDTKNALEEAALRESFPEMFSESQRCKPPHLNVDTLKDKLFQADVLLTHDFRSGKQLLDWMLAQNERLSARTDAQWLENRPEASKKSGDVQYKKALQKARQYGFFLGLESWKWLENR